MNYVAFQIKAARSPNISDNSKLDVNKSSEDIVIQVAPSSNIQNESWLQTFVELHSFYEMIRVMMSPIFANLWLVVTSDVSESTSNSFGTGVKLPRIRSMG